MNSQLKDIVTSVRNYLVEPKTIFWTDDELLHIAINGCKDLWAAILDTYGDHFLIVSKADPKVSLEVEADVLSNVPDNVFRVHMLEPWDTTTDSTQNGVYFKPRKLNHPDFIAARSLQTTDPNTAGIIFYDVSGAGAPVGAPIIRVAPKVSTRMELRLFYNPTLPDLGLDSPNPIPGESDQALIAYTIAFARAKEMDQRAPDPNWIAVYATEKQSVLKRITPRQDQEAEVVDGLFEGQY